MGNDNEKSSNNSKETPKILLKLRTRDIILHYAFKMTLVISDIGMFPHQLQGLKLWDLDVILSRFVILESQKFRSKNVLIFKAGVGIAGIAMRKWTDAKGISMCDFRDEVIKNISSNCNKNGAKNINIFKINYDQMLKSATKYDCILFPDLLSQGFPPLMILDIIKKILNPNGQAILILQQNKEAAKSFISIIDKSQFKIANSILTAEQYEASPLLNKLQGQQQFPSVSDCNFYSISLIKIQQQKEKKQNNVDKMASNFDKIIIKEKDTQKKIINQKLNTSLSNQIIKKQQIISKIQVNIQSNKQQIEIAVPISHLTKISDQKPIQNSPHKELNLQLQQKQLKNHQQSHQNVQINDKQERIVQKEPQINQQNQQPEQPEQVNNLSSPIQTQKIQQDTKNDHQSTKIQNNSNISQPNINKQQSQIAEQLTKPQQIQIQQQIIQAQDKVVQQVESTKNQMQVVKIQQQQNIQSQANEVTKQVDNQGQKEE